MRTVSAAFFRSFRHLPGGDYLLAEACWGSYDARDDAAAVVDQIVVLICELRCSPLGRQGRFRVGG